MRTTKTLIGGVAVLAALSLGACGDTPERLCAVEDASVSTAYAQPAYNTRLEDDVRAVATRGGSARVAVATGDPFGESDIHKKDFSDVQGGEKSSARVMREDELLADVDDDVRAARAGRGDPTNGSGLIGAMKLMDGQGCTQLVLLSDGFETGDLNVYHDDILTEAGRERLVRGLETRGRLGDFDGAELAIPFGGYQPQGNPLSKERRDALPELWGLIADRSHAHLVWKR